MTGTVLENILDVFEAVSSWIVSSVTGIIPMFYDAQNGLTFLGILAIAGLAFSVAFLLIGIVQRFLRFE